MIPPPLSGRDCVGVCPRVSLRSTRGYIPRPHPGPICELGSRRNPATLYSAYFLLYSGYCLFEAYPDYCLADAYSVY